MRRRLTSLSISGLLLAAVGIGTHLVSGPAVGTVHIRAVSTPAAAVVAQSVPLSTPYFSTVLPAGYSLKRSQVNAGQPVDIQVFASDAAAKNQLAIAGGVMPSDGLAGVGDYLLRTGSPASYQPYGFSGQPVGSNAFRSVAEPGSVTVFWMHAGRYVEITGESDQAGLAQSDRDIVALVQAWQWL